MKERNPGLESEPQYPAPKWVRYDPKDVQKLRNFLSQKGMPVSEISPITLMYPAFGGKPNPLSFAHTALISGAIDGSAAIALNEDQRGKLRQIGCFSLSLLNKEGTEISSNSVIFLNKGRYSLGEEAILQVQEFVLEQVGDNERVLNVPTERRIPAFKQ